MADLKKYLDEIGLKKLIDRIKTYDAASLTVSKEYTDQEVAKVTSGTIVVKEAEHATSADSATTAANANHATTADSASTANTATSATKATQDGNGKVIVDTYETKDDASAKLAEAKKYTDDEIAALSYYTEGEIDAKVDAINSDIDVVEGKIDAFLNANAVKDDVIDTLVEIQQYIEEDTADAAALIESVSSNESAISSHTGNGDVHVTAAQKTNWNAAYTHSQDAHNYAGSSTSGGVANSAAKLETARNIILAGDISGATTFDGSGDASINATVTSMHGITTAGDGAAYTATVDGITALTAGVSFIMIPHTNSTTTTPTLNVNSLGAKGLRMRGSTATGTAMAASAAAWLASGRPVQITYNGLFWVAEVTRPAASDLSGVVPVTSGGTGASDAATARTNLGITLENLGLTATVAELNYVDGVTSNVQTQLDAKANKSDIAATKSVGASNSAAIYVKISDFGSWGTGTWSQKGFAMLITSRAGEMVWLAVSSDDSNTNAKAIRLLNTYSKINAIYYSASESAVYVRANAWCNNINAHLLSNINGDYVPTVATASALASDAVQVTITEFGASSSTTNIGDSTRALTMTGSAANPTYNGNDLALKSDIEELLGVIENGSY